MHVRAPRGPDGGHRLAREARRGAQPSGAGHHGRGDGGEYPQPRQESQAARGGQEGI